MLLPSDPDTLARYEITQNQARLLNLTVVVPLIGIWYLALNGFVRLREYSKLIRDTNEGWAFTLLANGLMVLAFGLPINSIVSSIFNYVAVHNTNFVPTATILKNYLALIIALVAFGLLARGATLLVVSNKRTNKYKPVLPLFMAPIMILLTCIFTWLVLAMPAEGVSDAEAYYLPNWLIIFTVVIPYLAAWVSGLMALYFLHVHRNKVKGTIYKQAFNQLANGIGLVTLVSVLVQLLTTLSGQLNRLNLTPILFILYILVILYAVGFWYIAHGSKKLQKFEEV
jgi:hypothetical protein